MRQILMVLDGRDLNVSLIRFGCSWARSTQSKLMALFLHPGQPHEVPPVLESTAGYGGGAQIAAARKTSAAILQGEAYFRKACIREEVVHQVLERHGNLMDGAILHSRYADFILVNPWLSLFQEESGVPSAAVKRLLIRSHCPVMIASEPPLQINQLVFCFDGSLSSVYAIKQFTYLFPRLWSKKAILFTVAGEEEPSQEPDPEMIEWLKSNYANVHAKSVTGKKEEALMNFLLSKKNAMVVMGAYGRSQFSNFLKQSTAEQPLRFLEHPFFIAHS